MTIMIALNYTESPNSYTTVSTKNKTAKLKLNNLIEVNILANSNLKIPKYNTLENNILLEGQAIIKLDTNQKIKINKLVISSKSGELYISQSQHIRVACIRGKFTIELGNSKIDISKNTYGIAEKGVLKFVKISKNTFYDIREGRLSFDDVTLFEICDDLQKLFGIRVILDHTLFNKKFTGVFNNCTIPDILESIKRIHYFKYQKFHNRYEIKS